MDLGLLASADTSQGHNHNIAVSYIHLWTNKNSDYILYKNVCMLVRANTNVTVGGAPVCVLENRQSFGLGSEVLKP